MELKLLIMLQMKYLSNRATKDTPCKQKQVEEDFLVLYKYVKPV